MFCSSGIPDAPGKPTTGQSEIGDRWVTVDWVPGSDGYGPIRNYTIQKRDDYGSFTDIADYIPANVTQFTITGYLFVCF